MKPTTLHLTLLLSISLLKGISANEKTPWLDEKFVNRKTDGLSKLEGSNPAQWRVIWKTDPANKATVSWTTATQGKNHVVHYDLMSKKGLPKNYTFKKVSDRNGRFSGSGGEHFHHARLAELKPSTTYWFVIESDGNLSPEMHFTTAPMDDRDFSVIFGGDSRTGHFERAQVNLLMAALSEENPEIIAFAHGGDYIVSGKNWGQWSRWLSQHELTVAASGKVLPIIPTRGNHDGGPLFDEIFDSPGGKERENYFSTRLSPQVALVTLNSETKAGGAQRTWLGKTLESLRPKVRWLLAEYHRPAWPAVKKPGAAKEFWVPLFEEFDVDLVVESDGHVIKRTVPIRNEKKDS
ncbi:MAG: metallophosphoesterase family protein, partial [Opitutae bacterium]|nr:metallophosphoesterase family protein [Opitutae bacterium]